jgi:mannosyltransferase
MKSRLLPTRRSWRWRVILIVTLSLFLESYMHQWKNTVYPPSEGLAPLDSPFQTGCAVPRSHEPRANATILMLARNSEAEDARAAVQSLEHRFNRWFGYPITFLNDKPWSQEFIARVSNVSSGPVEFAQVPKHMWGFPDFMDVEYARERMEVQGMTGVLHGDQESYHHMCRFYSG